MNFRDFKTHILAIANSSKIAAYLHGIKVHVPEIGEIEIRAKTSSRSIRPTSLQWNEFSYFTDVESSNGIQATGFGEGNSSILALQKSIAEGVERLIFKSLKQTSLGTKSSNGWAAHVTANRAETAATMELLERDAVLVHWLTKTPFLEISVGDFPKPLSFWMKNLRNSSQRFKNLRVLVSCLGYVPTITTILLDDDGFAVLSHATDPELEVAIDKALSETCRIAHIAHASIDKVRSLNRPEDHALFYALHEKMPQFLFGKKIDLKSANLNWKKYFNKFDPAKLGIRFNTMKCGPLFVSRASSDRVQDLFFGETNAAQKNGWINERRITEAVGLTTINPMPHFVP